MSTLLGLLQRQAARRDAVAVEGVHGATTYASLLDEATALAAQLQQRRVRVLATLLDNGVAWIVADLAADLADAVHVPLPAFFTEAQRRHALQRCGAQALLTAEGAASGEPIVLAGEPCRWQPLPGTPPPLPQDTAKVTFTSGSTGQPKGVCLGRAAQWAVADGLVQATAGLGIERHLNALPLPVLLENIAGVHAPLLRGATIVSPPLHDVGLSGSSSFDPARLDSAVRAAGAHSAIVLPQMLRAWVAWLRAARLGAPPSLRFVAVGGAAVGAGVLAAARALGLPVYEGYGLSEAASVQTLNLPGADRPGSAGRALPHARLRVSADGEIEVAGSLHLGYLGDAAGPGEWLLSGDLGSIDADGFLHLHGRRGALLITAYGRNVSPEWVEAALREQPAIGEAVVYGDGAPRLSALLWPAANADDGALTAAVDAANAALPDYARIARWHRARAAFSPVTGLATPNGRPRRAAIAALHADLYASSCVIEQGLHA